MLRAIKAIVIGLGAILVGGTLVLVGALALRARHAARVAAVLPSPAGAGYRTALDMPAGARLLALQPAGGRLLLRLALFGGGEEIVVVDLGSGARLGTIELSAAATQSEQSRP